MTFTTMYLAGSKNTNNVLDVPMVPSSVITVSTNGECLTCGGFSLGETVCLRNFKFIVNYIGGLCLSLKRGNAGVASWAQLAAVHLPSVGHDRGLR
jgi:hypothetical protein